MWMMLRVIPIMWRAVRPSRVVDMPAVVNTFWLPKGYEGLTFFGQILAPSQAEADRFNSGYSTMKNHEMIHLRQAQACGDSWLRFLSEGRCDGMAKIRQDAAQRTNETLQP